MSPPTAKSTFEAPDGTSGAIMRIPDGCIGEQAELTKNGFGSNDFIDLSNICGAGGNLIVQQNLNDAWNRADQGARDNLSQCTHVSDGVVKRIDSPKDFPQLEFVRSFADGKTYVGVGAWGGSPGNANDNAQSTIRKPQGQYARDTPESVMAAAYQEPMYISSADDGSPGIVLNNASQRECEYFFYDNYWNGDGTAGANFDHPLTSVKLQPNETQFVSLSNTFKSRLQRGIELPATRVEFQVEAVDGHGAHGDILL
ncbi:hypothetical protein P171DRAFT_487750 [Karstenula rhodostoma CBS 690.94]|uniref:Uncharacterized protein n=1 Tax=Karstenula rhodostoma CBS 690.94 TaxID=1392251 RepID=A0A9P4PE89_9PLEO|nr:hypothetical protein P171DRAFT_487750 [Karstenula rhodostoma CBS 690.94]